LDAPLGLGRRGEVDRHRVLGAGDVVRLVRLRDRARLVLQSQNEGWPEKERNEARRELNWAYDRFESVYGPINKNVRLPDDIARKVPYGTERLSSLVKIDRNKMNQSLDAWAEAWNSCMGLEPPWIVLAQMIVGKVRRLVL